MSVLLNLFHNQGKGAPIGLPYWRRGGGFSPLDIAGLQLWLDGSDITTLFQDAVKTTPVTADGDVVGAWADKSGNGSDVLQVTTAKKPLYKVNIKNGLSALLFDGADDYLTDAFTQLSQPFCYIVVAQMDATVVDNDAYVVLFDSDDVTNRNALLQSSINSPNRWNIFAGSGLELGVTNANWNLFYVLFAGASSNLRINGASIGSGNAGAHNSDGINVGAAYTNTLTWKGYINELLIYDPSLSDANRTLIEAHLNSKWGLY